jgi:hypothetical protein
MKSHYLLGIALAAILAFGAPMMAQVVSVPPGVTVPLPLPVIEQSFTTGMVGFTLNQTARLNVLNVNTVAIASTVAAANSTAPANCTVQLQFFDGKNTLLGQTVVPNFAPGTATTFDLPRTTATLATTSRTEVRGVVTVNPAPTLVESPAVTGYCAVKTTLEIFDNTTGSTVVLTSDTSPAGIGFAAPALVAAVR